MRARLRGLGELVSFERGLVSRCLGSQDGDDDRGEAARLRFDLSRYVAGAESARCRGEKANPVTRLLLWTVAAGAWPRDDRSRLVAERGQWVASLRDLVHLVGYVVGFVILERGLVVVLDLLIPLRRDGVSPGGAAVRSGGGRCSASRPSRSSAT